MRGGALSSSLLLLLAYYSCSSSAFLNPSTSGRVKTRPNARDLTVPATVEDSNDETTSTEDVPAPAPTTLKPTISSVASTRDSSGTKSALKKSEKASNRWDSFDYYQQWYPVSWDIDIQDNQPTKVTLFDVDYVIGRDSEGDYSALEDRCPHKAAALSEGRMTESGLFQCAYHGWSFDGQNGDCVQIPQAPPGAPLKKKCAKPVPIVEHQGMVWLWPGPDFPTGLPPSIPEMDMEGWKTIKVVRDFPDVDWPLLVSNIMDPDHGCFAHTALAFDMYSANAQHPLQVTEEWEPAGWGFSSSVSAVDKVLKVDQDKRASLGMKTKKAQPKPGSIEKAIEYEKTPDTLATSRLWAPTTVSLCRRDENGETKFITAFWVTPVGTGKSRFMSAAVSSVFPFQIPRWIFQINLNRFLDQDTLLVATQQPPLLKAEAEGVEKPRSSLFTYGSPTDATVRLIDRFWDSTLHKVPNRMRTLHQMYSAGKLNETPSREVVLDRNTQHLKICPDSQGFVRNCRRITKASLAVTAVWVTKALWDRALPRFRFLPVLTAFVAWAADQLRRQFYFCKTEASRDKDLKQIPVKAWLDP